VQSISIALSALISREQYCLSVRLKSPKLNYVINYVIVLHVIKINYYPTLPDNNVIHEPLCVLLAEAWGSKDQHETGDFRDFGTI